MKNKNILSSIKLSFIGLFTAIKKEKNFKFYLINIIITLCLNICFGFTIIEYFIWAITIVGVFSTECINTAIEYLCNFLTEQKNDKIKIIKDISAGAVLCWGLAFYIFEIAIIGVKFL